MTDAMRPEDLVGRARVRIFSGAAGCEQHVMAEGVVVGYCDAPTLLIRHDDGTQSSWSVRLPREIVETAEPEGSA